MNIIQVIIAKLRFHLWAKLKINFYPSFYQSHSQFGEDMIVRGLIPNLNTGFYVDIGSHHPVLISNTYHFYCKGWRGINIDAIPGSMELFKILRPRDINLEACLSKVDNSEAFFFIFDPAPFNTCDPQVAEYLIANDVKFIEKIKLKTRTLKSCLDECLPDGVEIDLMNIDIEGMDEEILMSNDWNHYKPKILIFEKKVHSIQEIYNSSIIDFLNKIGYNIVAISGYSVILQLQ